MLRWAIFVLKLQSNPPCLRQHNRYICRNKLVYQSTSSKTCLCSSNFSVKTSVRSGIANLILHVTTVLFYSPFFLIFSSVQLKYLQTSELPYIKQGCYCNVSLLLVIVAHACLSEKHFFAYSLMSPLYRYTRPALFDTSLACTVT